MDQAETIDWLGLVRLDTDAVIDGDNLSTRLELVQRYRFQKRQAQALLRRRRTRINIENRQVRGSLQLVREFLVRGGNEELVRGQKLADGVPIQIGLGKEKDGIRGKFLDQVSSRLQEACGFRRQGHNATKKGKRFSRR